MEKYAVIVAGGSGTRMGGGIPKQFRSLKGRPVLWWSMNAFHQEDPNTHLILVLPEEFITLWEDFYSTLPKTQQYPYEVISGGHTRGESVTKGLSLIKDEDSLVAVHDGARPLVTVTMISEGWKAAGLHGAAIPVTPVTDSIREIEGDESKAVDRSRFMSVQTPQVFHTGLLKESYAMHPEEVFTDDASVVEKSGHKVALYTGSVDNIKITNPHDMMIAETLLSNSNQKG